MFSTYCADDGIHGCRYKITGALEDLRIMIDNPRTSKRNPQMGISCGGASRECEVMFIITAAALKD